MSAIVINDLIKKIGGKNVLNNLNLEILEGESFAILGLDDSGKSTLAKILFNFLKPTKGSVKIFDMDVIKDSKGIKDFCSYVPQEVWIYEDLKPISIFKKTLALHGIRNREDIGLLVEYFNLNTKKRFGDLDESEKKKVAIINALIVKPKLLILDEPTFELDEDTREKFYRYINNLKKEENVTILLLTNSLSDAQRNCDRIAYLDNGEIKDIEFLKDKKANDKVLKISDEVVDITPFLNIGAKIVKQEPGDTVLYYDQDLKLLSQAVANSDVVNYNIEDSRLADKMNAYYKKEVEQ